ncbi:hypothetical protein GCM10023080_077430 [Streptomyces pseudoechinosporeus]
MTRSAADFETPNSGASCRIVKFVLAETGIPRARLAGADLVAVIDDAGELERSSARTETTASAEPLHTKDSRTGMMFRKCLSGPARRRWDWRAPQA